MLTAIVITALQAAPPPIALRDHAPPRQIENVIAIDCGAYRARVSRRWSSSNEADLKLTIGGHDIPPAQLATVRNATPILNQNVSVSGLCHPESLIVETAGDSGRFAIIFADGTLQAVMKDNHTIWSARADAHEK